MSSSLPDGYRLRAGADGDVDAVTDLVVAEERAVRGESHLGAADTHDWWRLLGKQGEAWVVADERARLVGALGISRRGDLFNSWIAIAPAHFGRGLDALLLRHAEDRTRSLGGSSLHVDTFGENLPARDLYTSSGYAEERRHYLMRIDFAARPHEPEWPAGVVCSTFEPERDAHEFHQVMNEAFDGQWGFRPMQYEEWSRLRLEAPDFDPQIWLVARDGAEVAGVLRGDPKRWSCGWIGMVGVRPRWQRRGIGTALVRQAFRVFYDRGERSVGLGVDTQNPTGATRLYERLGMQVKAEDITYAKVLA
jgi:mycothiol synthase